MERPEERVFQFRVTLLDVDPPIWRRIQVPEEYSFWDLHVAIQDAMGWEDCHLHEFTIQNPKTKRLERLGIPSEDDWGGEPLIPGWERKVSGYFTESNTKARYWYDFGDDWHHEVVLERVLSSQEGAHYPLCVAGERACPPEDCGGPFGYAELLTALVDPSHEDHEDMVAWAAEGFDPERFDPARVVFDDPSERWAMAFGEEHEEDQEELSGRAFHEFFKQELRRLWLKIQEQGLESLDKEEATLGELLVEHGEFFGLVSGDTDPTLEDQLALHIFLHNVLKTQVEGSEPEEASKFHEAMVQKGFTPHEAAHLLMAVFTPLVAQAAKTEGSVAQEDYIEALRQHQERSADELRGLLE